jgi:hypothetical protein
VTAWDRIVFAAELANAASYGWAGPVLTGVIVVAFLGVASDAFKGGDRRD